ncbi:hypothetical protein [Melittangium boletus]|uniref:AgmX/PglI C-terminal domain-containing protein n=1 Tax=Melittangium boletus DSM 14713 TaxID=1294270 RepID=A0A250IHI6_9BACT|nr:hypothetical protein [Melittangium boletus]ATB31279.1 hypothetical protein MEBOL_004741 [Melittangium boletus DSM 14713]
MSGRAVLLWVVLPFVALSALALWLTREPPLELEHPVAPRPSPPPVEHSPPTPPPPVEPIPPPAPPPVAAREEEPLPEIPPGTWSPEEVRAALRAIQPLMRQCLQDAEGRHVGAQSVRLRFTLESQEGQGHFLRGEVVESTLQDPFVFACLLDTLADTPFPAPPGRPPLTLSYPFRSRPPP